MKKLLSKVNGIELIQCDNEYYQVVFPHIGTMVNTSGTKEKVRTELERWKKEVDMNNPFMLKVEEAFIAALM